MNRDIVRYTSAWEKRRRLVGCLDVLYTKCIGCDDIRTRGILLRLNLASEPANYPLSHGSLPRLPALLRLPYTLALVFANRCALCQLECLLL